MVNTILATVFKRRRPRHALYTLAGALVLPLITLSLLAATGAMPRIEGYATDTRFRHRGDLPAPKDIIVVNIDSKSSNVFNSWPLPREHFTNVIKNLHGAGVSMIVLDVPMNYASPTGTVANARAAIANIPAWQRAGLTAGSLVNADKEFIKAMRGSKPIVVIASKRDALSGLRTKDHPKPVRESGVTVGARATMKDAGGVTRTYVTAGSAARAAVMHPKGGAALAVAKSAPKLPATMQLNWYGGPSSFARASFNDIFQGPALMTRSYRNKIVVIGLGDGIARDDINTPVGTMPHSFAVATAIANMRDGTWLGSISWQSTVALTLGLMLLVWVLLEFVAIWIAVPLCVLIGVGWALLAARLFTDGVALPVAAPLIGATLAFLTVALVLVATSVRERLRIKGLFARYVSPDVVQELLDSEDTIKLGGVDREITVLFSDIRGFTSMSETIDPAEMVSQLNDYFAEMVDVVTFHSGTLDKFLGDGLMAIFGAPIDTDDHAANACAAALEMLDRLRELNARRAADGLTPIDIGIGLHTGHAVVGNVGSPLFRVDFTAIGDTVNLAARLEGQTKELGAAIVVSDATVAAAGDAFTFRQLGSVIVKGRAAATDVYELVPAASGEPVGAAAGAPAAPEVGA